MEKIFHIPLKRFFRYISKKIKKFIYLFIGYERASAWKRLQEVRELSPSRHTQLLSTRKEQPSKRVLLSQKRKERRKVL